MSLFKAGTVREIDPRRAPCLRAALHQQEAIQAAVEERTHLLLIISLLP